MHVDLVKILVRHDREGKVFSLHTRLVETTKTKRKGMINQLKEMIDVN